jgi:glyceraldehyde-3-phosphate dehydrogenase (NAD(P))
VAGLLVRSLLTRTIIVDGLTHAPRPNKNGLVVMTKRNVHIIGTGTIGEPLIGLFCAFADAWDIDQVSFHKRTPLRDERAKVESMIRRGAKLVVDTDKVADFEAFGHKVSGTAEQAIADAAVVIDCTPVGNKLKPQYLEIAGPKVYMAQGSEFGFGQQYARGINDEALKLDERFVQIVSCNTHNICVMLKTLGEQADASIGVDSARFLCLRRASDISQATDFIPAPEVGKHDDPRFGTHHARDAWHVFQTLGHDLDLFSSAVKLPTQYMHILQFSLAMSAATSKQALVERLQANPRVALTEKRSSGVVFSFGRDHGFYGRILNETVIPPKCLHVSEDGRKVTGFCFTPQDGNSLLSSMACALWYLDQADPRERLQTTLQPYMFDEI